MSEGAVLGIVVELSLKLFVSLLNVDADTDGDEQKRACDDQNDNKRAAIVIFGGRGGRLVGFGRIVRLVSDLPVVSIEADERAVGVCEVEHHVVVGEEGVSNGIAWHSRAYSAIDEELASVIKQGLV